MLIGGTHSSGCTRSNQAAGGFSGDGLHLGFHGTQRSSPHPFHQSKGRILRPARKDKSHEGAQCLSSGGRSPRTSVVSTGIEQASHMKEEFCCIAAPSPRDVRLFVRHHGQVQIALLAISASLARHDTDGDGHSMLPGVSFCRYDINAHRQAPAYSHRKPGAGRASSRSRFAARHAIRPTQGVTHTLMIVYLAEKQSSAARYALILLICPSQLHRVFPRRHPQSRKSPRSLSPVSHSLFDGARVCQPYGDSGDQCEWGRKHWVVSIASWQG